MGKDFRLSLWLPDYQRNTVIDLIEHVDSLVESTSPEKQLVDNIMRKGHPHPFMRDTVAFGFKGDPQPLVTLELIAQTDAVYLTGLMSTVQKKGFGKYVMKLVIDEADKLGVTLVGTAKPFGIPEVRIPKAKLVKFYKGLGFHVGSDGKMIREPK